MAFVPTASSPVFAPKLAKRERALGRVAWFLIASALQVFGSPIASGAMRSLPAKHSRHDNVEPRWHGRPAKVGFVS